MGREEKWSFDYIFPFMFLFFLPQENFQKSKLIQSDESQRQPLWISSGPYTEFLVCIITGLLYVYRIVSAVLKGNVVTAVLQ